MLTDHRVRAAFDVTRAPEKVQERYGRNAFGWSLLMARRLVEAGVNLVQVNLGNNETWDTHGEAFPHLKEKLLPPTDRALSVGFSDDDRRCLVGMLQRLAANLHLTEGVHPEIGNVGDRTDPGRNG